MIGACWVDAVLIGDDLPELGADLITALSCLDVNDLSHRSFKLNKLPKYRCAFEMAIFFIRN